MDNRIALRNSSILDFPSMTVTISNEIGRGSNAIVYKGTYPDLHSPVEHHVLIKELFPLHPQSAVYREDNGTICCDGAEEFFEFHKYSFEKGNRIHLELLKRSPDDLGGNINTFSHNGTLYTVLNYNSGRSLDDELKVNTHSLEQLVRMMRGLLLSLQDFHRNGFLHLDIAPDNVMLLGTGERERVMLIDYNSTMALQSSQTNFSIKPGYSSPEVQRGDVSHFTQASDLYSVAAVFLRCLRGYALMPFETAQKTPPAISDCQVLQDSPQTVISMVKQILYRGLAANVSRRYTSVNQMLTAFEELEDRIKGVGITHWALWEAGKRTVNHLIKNNTAFHYLNDTEEMFPIYAESKQGERLPIGTHIEGLLNGERHLFVTAPGGMGKTTSMLYELKRNTEVYSSRSPAIIYIPLHGKASAHSNYITDKVLEHLQFKSDVQNYEQARHALHRLFSTPLTVGTSSRPAVVLFLDGLNEVKEGLETILDEIATLSKLEGVRFYVTSRTECEIPGFSYQRISPISLQEEQQILTRHHLLMPATAEMQQLLRTPMMLSMFLELSRQSNMQPSAASSQELMDAYIDSLVQKEVENLPEESPLRLKIDVAVHLVLPRIAAKMDKAGRPVDDAVLLKETAACYKLIRSPLFIRAFPQWIGHKKAILSQTDSCDDWYDSIVREVLWRKLGMLIKDEQGRYVLVHQIVCDYLISKQKEAKKKISRFRAVKHGLITAACLLLAIATAFAVICYPKPVEEEPLPPYDINLTSQILTNGITAYQRAGYQYEYIHQLINTACFEPTDYQNARQRYNNSISTLFMMSPDPSVQQIFVDELLKSGSVFLWTNEPLKKEEYLELLSLLNNRKDEYADIVGALDYLMNHYDIYDKYGAEYMTMAWDLIELDAQITATLYAISCRGNVNAMIDAYNRSEDATQNLEAQTLSTALTANPLQNQHLPKEEKDTALNDSLKVLIGQRDNLYFNLQSQGAYITYITQKGNES